VTKCHALLITVLVRFDFYSAGLHASHQLNPALLVTGKRANANVNIQYQTVHLVRSRLTTSDLAINGMSGGILQPFNGLFSRTTWVSRYQKSKTNQDFTGARDRVEVASAAPHCRMAMPAPHHSVFYRPDALPAAQPTASKH